jgi:hypothetical protein
VAVNFFKRPSLFGTMLRATLLVPSSNTAARIKQKAILAEWLRFYCQSNPL